MAALGACGRQAPCIGSPTAEEFRRGRDDRQIELLGIDDHTQFRQPRRTEMHTRRRHFTIAPGMCGSGIEKYTS